MAGGSAEWITPFIGTTLIIMCRMVDAEKRNDNALQNTEHAFEPYYVIEEMDCPEKVDPSIFYFVPKVQYGSSRRALFTVPDQFEIAESVIPGAGLGAFAKTFIASNTWLGEYEGEYVSLDHTLHRRRAAHYNHYAWTLEMNYKEAYNVDAHNVRTSNWLRYVNCARTVFEENVDMRQCFGKVYYRTKKDVAPGQELLVFYGAEYAKGLGITYLSYYGKSVQKERNDF